MAKKKLKEFVPQQMSANRHTQRGMGMLEGSMREVGYTAPMIAARDGEVISGSARLEASAEVFGVDVEPIVVESDGKRPIVVLRTDIPNANTKIAKCIGLLENRVQEVNLEFDPSILAQMEAEDAGILAGLWGEDELNELLSGGDIGGGGIDPSMMGERSVATDQYAVIVMCDGEAHQQQVYNDLMAEGYKVKVVVT